MKSLRISTLVSASFLLLLPLLPTDAQRVSMTTGNTLLDACESKPEFQQAFCMGYIAGVSDSANLDSAAHKDRRRVCTPADVTNGQTMDVVIKHLKEHPENRQSNATILIVTSLANAFPCSNH